ncbi:MAG TPA: GIY-YIG nuclease family protein [bacterium]|nr:GIY-YIG nuclease family protein [bacterium]
MFTVYVIRDASGRRYVGQTEDLAHRLEQHNSGESFWTKRGFNWRVVYTEEYPTREQAMTREQWLKTGVGRQFLDRTLGLLGS